MELTPILGPPPQSLSFLSLCGATATSPRSSGDLGPGPDSVALPSSSPVCYAPSLLLRMALHLKGHRVPHNNPSGPHQGIHTPSCVTKEEAGWGSGAVRGLPKLIVPGSCRAPQGTWPWGPAVPLPLPHSVLWEACFHLCRSPSCPLSPLPADLTANPAQVSLIG